MLADAGYWAQANATAPGPDRLIATTKDHKQRRAARELGTTSGPPPPDATPIEEMEHLLRTPARRRRLRPALRTDRADLRRPQTQPRDPQLPPPRPHAANSEWAFMHLAGNILKLHQHHAATATA